MQIGVSMWDAAGFLGMSEKTLRDVYGHHHPDYLRSAAKALGERKPTLLVKSLVNDRRKPTARPQATENIGSGRSRPRTSLQLQIPVNREIYREFSQIPRLRTF